MTRLTQICVIFLASPLVGTAHIDVSSDFPGGSAEVVSVDADQQAISIRPAIEIDRGWPCWWYFRLDGLVVGKPVRVEVSANPAPYRGSQVLNSGWLLPDRAAISADNGTWQPTSNTERGDKRATYTFEASAATMWVAWGPPYLPSHAHALLTECADKLPDAELFQLARTRHNRPVRAIRIGDPVADATEKFGIWVQARQHAWEAGSSWVAQGFLQWIASDEPAAIELRRKSNIIVVPIMDVDSVSDGRGGKDAVPRDHNRDWDDGPVYPEVLAAQGEIRRLDRARRLDLFIDLHNPAPNDRRPFFFGPKIEELVPIRQRNHVRWIGIARGLIGDLANDYRFASYIQTQEERDRVSINWVRNHTSPHVVATTLETSWNRPEGNQQGYQLVGQQLGEAMANYFSGNPRAE